jgi:hypothetical protein
VNRVVGCPEKSCPTSLETTANPAAFAAASTCPANTACVPMPICLNLPFFVIAFPFYDPGPVKMCGRGLHEIAY